MTWIIVNIWLMIGPQYFTEHEVIFVDTSVWKRWYFLSLIHTVLETSRDLAHNMHTNSLEFRHTQLLFTGYINHGRTAITLNHYCSYSVTGRRNILSWLFSVSPGWETISGLALHTAQSTIAFSRYVSFTKLPVLNMFQNSSLKRRHLIYA